MNTPVYLFESTRLGFRNWKDEDIPLFAALNADPVVMEYFPSTISYDETAAKVEKYRARIDEFGYGLFAVDRLDDGSFIGFIGLNYAEFKSSFNPAVEIGWRLMQSAWGQGFATEGAIRCLQYAFEVMDVPQVFSFTAILNTRSERVMQKAGMRQIGEFAHPGVPVGHPMQQHVLYRIRKDEL